jgi:hypothetical protein
VRAFEVEHATSVYSGILRMADLLALQPNMDIKLHIVAPKLSAIRSFRKFGGQFSLYLKKALSPKATLTFRMTVFASLVAQKHLSHLSDTVLDEYAEKAE